jgi:hypothetical protein
MKKDISDAVTAHELLVSNMLEQEALVQLLVKKGLITEAEMLDEIREMKLRLLERGKPGSA